MASRVRPIRLTAEDAPPRTNADESASHPSGFDFGGQDDVLGEADESRVPEPYTRTLLPAGAVASVVYDRSSFVIRNVGGVQKLSALMTIMDGELAGRPLLYARNVPQPGWLKPQHFLARDWVGVMPSNVRLPCLPKFDPQPKSRDRKGRARLLRVGRGLLEEMFVGVGNSAVVMTALTVVVKRWMDADTGEWVERDEGLWYSRVARILSREAGWPRGAERKRRRGGR